MMLATLLISFLFGLQDSAPAKAGDATKSPPAKKAEAGSKADDEKKPDDKKASAKAGAKPAEKQVLRPATNSILDLPITDDVPTVTKLRDLAAEPYRIRVWMTLQQHPAIGPAIRQAIREEIQSAAERNFGSAWILDFGDPPAGAPLSPAAPIEEMPNLEPLRKEYAGIQKILWADVAVDGKQIGSPPFVVSVREYDFSFASWGPSVVRVTEPSEPLPTAVFRLMYRQFRANIAIVGLEPQHKQVRVIVKGILRQDPLSPYPILAAGAPLKVTRDVLRRGEYVARTPILWTYLIFEKLDPDRRSGVCKVMSSFLYPVDSGVLRRSKALGIAASNSENASTEVFFYTLQQAVAPGADAGRRALAGYEVTLRVQDQKSPVLVGNTDRRGRITLAASTIDRTGEGRPRVCEVTVQIGQIPIIGFPIVPGDEARREVRVAPDPLLADVSGKINALQSEIVDTLARQAILTKRLDSAKELNKKAKEEEEVARIEKRIRELAADLNKLPGNKYFQDKLKIIEADAKKVNENDYRQKSFSSRVKRLFGGVEKLLKDKTIGVQVNVRKEGEGEPTPDPAAGEKSDKK